MAKRASFIRVLIVGFPLGLIGLGVMSFALYEQRRVDKVAQYPMSKSITRSGMQDHFFKLESYMTPRGFEEGDELIHLERVVSYLRGSLSQMNTGMELRSQKGVTHLGRLWKEYRMSYGGGKGGSPIEIRVNYRTGANLDLVLALTLGEVLPRVPLSRPLELIFTPVEGVGEWRHGLEVDAEADWIAAKKWLEDFVYTLTAISK